MLNNAAVITLVMIATRFRLLQLAIVDLLYLSIAIHNVMVIAKTNIIVNVRLARVVSAGNNILHIVPKIRIMVRINPVMIPILMAFLITQYLMVKKGYSSLR